MLVRACAADILTLRSKLAAFLLQMLEFLFEEVDGRVVSWGIMSVLLYTDSFEQRGPYLEEFSRQSTYERFFSFRFCLLL